MYYLERLNKCTRTILSVVVLFVFINLYILAAFPFSSNIIYDMIDLLDMITSSICVLLVFVELKGHEIRILHQCFFHEVLFLHHVSQERYLY